MQNKSNMRLQYVMKKERAYRANSNYFKKKKKEK